MNFIGPKFGMTLLLLAGLHTGLSAQTETYWVNQSFEECKKKQAIFYMKSAPRSGAYQIALYGMDDVLRMKGQAKDEKGEVFDGLFEFYHANGQVESRGMYMDDHKVGVWERYDSRGNRLAERMYAAYSARRNAFFFVDEMPMYEGGKENFENFLKQKLRGLVHRNESAAKEAEIEVGFVVSESGLIENVELIRGLDEQWDKEALKKLKALPSWLPGKKSGESVRVWVQLAVDLSL